MMPRTARFACTTAAVVLISSACGERAPEGAEQPAGGDTAAQLDTAANPPAERVAQDTSRWLQAAGAVHEPRPGMRPVVLTSVEAATHEGYDRVTFEFSNGGVPGHDVAYTEEPIRECGPGNEVGVAGTGTLVVRLEPARAHDDQGQVTIESRTRAPSLPALEEMRLTCDFEGQVEWVLGVVSPAPFRVTELTAPPRLAVDVRHEP